MLLSEKTQKRYTIHSLVLHVAVECCTASHVTVGVVSSLMDPAKVLTCQCPLLTRLSQPGGATAQRTPWERAAIWRSQSSVYRNNEAHARYTDNAKKISFYFKMRIPIAGNWLIRAGAPWLTDCIQDTSQVPLGNALQNSLPSRTCSRWFNNDQFY